MASSKAPSAPSALVIGAGVNGLCTGIRLIESGFRVHIVSNQFGSFPDGVNPRSVIKNYIQEHDADPIVSEVAAAFWMPFLCAGTEDFVNWSRETYETQWKMQADPKSGVRPITCHVLAEGHARPWWASFVREYRDEPIENLPAGSNPGLKGYPMGFAFRTSLIESPIAMKYLVGRYLALGGTLEMREISSLESVRREADVVVNCTGIASRKLCNDESVHPIKGQVCLMDIPQLSMDHLYIDEAGPNQIAYIVPRNDGVICGGTAIAHDWNRKPCEKLTAGILERCSNIRPEVKDARIKKTLVGLRPARSELRLEVEKSTLSDGQGAILIHNYGHGGSGWTVCWGCASHVVKLVRTHSAAAKIPSKL